jgi:hypothetical protein
MFSEKDFMCDHSKQMDLVSSCFTRVTLPPTATRRGMQKRRPHDSLAPPRRLRSFHRPVQTTWPPSFPRGDRQQASQRRDGRTPLPEEPSLTVPDPDRGGGRVVGLVADEPAFKSCGDE